MIRELALACLVFRNVTNSTSPPAWNMTTTNVTSGDAPTWSIGEIADTALPLLNSTPSFQPSTQPLPEIKNVTVTTFPPTKIIILPLPTNSSNTTASPNITITDLPTKFFDENNTNPYPGYTLPTTPAVLETIMPEIVETEVPVSLAVSRIPAVYITLITLILTCLFFFISS